MELTMTLRSAATLRTRLQVSSLPRPRPALPQLPVEAPLQQRRIADTAGGDHRDDGGVAYRVQGGVLGDKLRPAAEEVGGGGQ